jgi:hypothetical protein
MNGLDGMDARYVSVTNTTSWDVTFQAPILAGERPGTRVLHALSPMTSRGHCLACRLLDACHHQGRFLAQCRRTGCTLAGRETP